VSGAVADASGEYALLCGKGKAFIHSLVITFFTFAITAR
jgi:hypothetical protein